MRKIGIPWMEEKCRKYSKPFSQLLDEKVIQKLMEIQTQLPQVINAERLDLLSIYRNSVGTTVKLDICFATRANDCAVDVCIAMGSLIVLGLNDYNQLPLKAAMSDDIPRDFL